MGKRLFEVAIFVIGLAAWAPSLRAQASVNENLETQTVVVDGTAGTDATGCGQGSNAPCKTISFALSIANSYNNASQGTKIVVNPGTYRETVTETSNANTTPAPITIQAATNGTVILSGADVFTGWTVYGGNSSIYTIPWTQNWGFCPEDTEEGAPYQAPIVLRREMVYIDGVLMTQVLDLAQMVYPGTFYVDDPHHTLYVWPPTGVDINSATVEISTRTPVINVVTYSQLVFRGLTIQYDSACHNSPAAYIGTGSSNILFDSDTFQWNNAKGLNLQTGNTSTPTQNITVENCLFLHNGETGATDFEALNTLWSNDTFNYNNWRGALGSYYSWAASGAYFDMEHNSTVTNLTAMYNQTNGVHWDTDNVGITATGLVSAGNLLNGVFFEKNQGPITFTGGIIADNMPNPAITNFVGGGVIFRNSEFIDVENTQVFGNGNFQLNVEGLPGGIPISNWQTGANYNLITSSLTWNGNVFEAAGPTYSVFADASLDGIDWADFIASGFSSTNNDWWNTQGNTTPFIVPEPFQPTYVDFPGWQAATGQDSASVYQEPNPDPMLTYTLPPPDAPDYWFVVSNSLVTEAADGTATYTVYPVPIGGFTGTINLSLVGVSDTHGLTGTITNNSINETGSSTIVLSALTSVPPGTYQATVIANSGNLTHAVTFNMIIPLTFVKIVPDTLAFPPTPRTTSSKPLLTKLTNFGTTPLAIASIVMSPQWTQTNTCGSLVAAGASCNFTVIFTPNGAKAFTGTMTIIDSDPTGSQVVFLTGTGTGLPVVQLVPQTLAFGGVTVGASSTLTSVLTNAGDGTLTISSQVFGGSFPGDYSETDNCGGSLLPGASCNINITFTPGASGSRTAKYTLTDNASPATQTITLTGTGQLPGVRLTPNPLAFGSVTLGASSSLTETLTNTGMGTLFISGTSISGTNSADFVQTATTCPATLASNATCIYTIQFTPTINGSESATFTLTDNAANSPQTVSLTGSGGTTGGGITFTPNPANFGNQLVGKRSTAIGITVKNGLTTTVTISSQTIAGTNASDFTIISMCPGTLAAGKSCIVKITFTPGATGPRTANLSLMTSAPGSPQTDPLTGVGTQPFVMLNPTSLNFGAVTTGTTSLPMTTTLTNTGTGTLTINAIRIAGAQASWFAETQNCGTSLVPGASCTITVTATPLAKRTGTASVSITDNAPNSPQTVSLTVTGN